MKDMSSQYKTTLRLSHEVKKKLDFIRKNTPGDLLNINTTIINLITAEYKRTRHEVNRVLLNIKKSNKGVDLS